ncbi:MAG: transporter [Vicinamibacterales bacterium]
MCVLLAGLAGAQEHVSEALTFLVTNQAVNTGSIARDTAAAEATSRTIGQALLASLATLPVTSTSGAFSYRLNPALGTVERSTQTFGPVFAERALTSGAGSASVGLGFQHLRFTALDGQQLRDGTLVTTANRFADEAVPFDVDAVTLALDADVMTGYVNLGLGSRVDVAVAAPVIWLRMDGTRVNTYRGQTFTQARVSSRAIGLADLLVRSKVSLFQEDGLGVAAGFDIRLPTGRERDLLGAGRTAVRVSAIGSAEGDRTSVHASVGLGVGGLARELTYSAAVSTALSPSVTLSAEALGRWTGLPGDIVLAAQPHPTLAGVDTLRLVPGTSHLQSLMLGPGVKWNLSDTWVVVAQAGVPMMKGGLRAPVLPFIGLEYSVAR